MAGIVLFSGPRRGAAGEPLYLSGEDLGTESVTGTITIHKRLLAGMLLGAIALGIAIGAAVDRLAPADVKNRSAPKEAKSTGVDKVMVAPAATWQGKPMSEWRRAYIARHGHQPPEPKAGTPR